MEPTESTESVRIDKWLWAVRLFKTRTLAAAECKGGKIKRAGQSLKASAEVRIGDRLEVPSTDGHFKRQVEVLQLIDKRVGAPLAKLACKDHTPADILEAARKQSIGQRAARLIRKEGDQGRMTKKQRRDWVEGLHLEM
jgi:ribosome-associated heat shock protein Hsp15